MTSNNMAEKNCPKCKTPNPVAANFCRHCRYEFSEASKNGLSLSPSIKVFHVKESDYTIGSKIHLEWETENATIVKINGTVVDESSDTEMIVDKPKVIILEAENDYDITKRELRITPGPLPTIDLFRSFSESVLIGQQTKLEWLTRNAERTEVVASDGAILGSGEDGYCNVSPTKTETYHLKCYAMGDPEIFVERVVVVQVLEPVKIEGFNADKESIMETEKVVLSWKVDNATSIEILPSVGEVTHLNKVVVYPHHTIVYRLVARNGQSMDETSVTIEVRNLPKFDLGLLGDISQINLPDCKVDLLSMGEDLKETRVDKWMMDPSAKMEGVFSRLLGYPKLIRKILNRSLQ